MAAADGSMKVVNIERQRVGHPCLVRWSSVKLHDVSPLVMTVAEVICKEFESG